ncbi:spermidine synthase [Streptosporangium becharense]|uniref:Spermidine synthase n=1 Tax=Streptosporangium becharense TaxID=1816182 RepID=A0A7W9MIS9_9ACTN|nr:fused MFS/spermidine synthase [Streptosporangium becharense]MBB2911168.1 spermidine synthase [Streptosporangium becharense]MBB5821774.1 spermidine synthase [Streptosporangium becharense]
MARREPREPMPGRYPVTFGEVDLLQDLDRSSGWVISKDGVPQSYVDLDDPTYLDFEYVRLMADVVDLLDEGPLDAVHVGGCACTLPRYVAATRPGSRQVVAEPDGGLVQLVRDQLRLKSVPRLKVKILDGRAATAELADASADLLVLDAFSGATMPIELATTEYMGDVARVLRPAGTLLVNVADGKGLAFARRVLATVGGVFPRVALLAEPGVLRGRRFGNLIVIASRAALPLPALTRRAAGGLTQARCVHGEDLVKFVAGARPLNDGDAVVVPVPPPAVFG